MSQIQWLAPSKIWSLMPQSSSKKMVAFLQQGPHNVSIIHCNIKGYELVCKGLCFVDILHEVIQLLHLHSEELTHKK